MQQKRGASDWTIGKLMGIVLLVLVLVIMTWGFTNQSAPIVQNFIGQIDNFIALITFGAFDTAGSGECVTHTSASLLLKDAGITLFERLEYVGISPDDEVVTLDVCQEAECFLKTGPGDYGYEYIDGVVQEGFQEGDARNEIYLKGIEKGETFTENRQIYWIHKELRTLLEEKSLLDFEDWPFTNTLRFYSSTQWQWEPYGFARWSSGAWTVYEGQEEIGEITTDTEGAITTFLGYAYDFSNDQIWYVIHPFSLEGFKDPSAIAGADWKGIFPAVLPTEYSTGQDPFIGEEYAVDDSYYDEIKAGLLTFIFETQEELRETPIQKENSITELNNLNGSTFIIPVSPQETESFILEPSYDGTAIEGFYMTNGKGNAYIAEVNRIQSIQEETIIFSYFVSNDMKEKIKPLGTQEDLELFTTVYDNTYKSTAAKKFLEETCA